MLAVRLVYRIEEIWERKIPTATLLEESTIEHLAKVLEDPGNVSQDEASLEIEKYKVGRRFFSLRERIQRDHKRKDRVNRF